MPTPYASGDSKIEQGISKAGNRRVRALLVELAWSWSRLQPGSTLTQWFNRRFARGGTLLFTPTIGRRWIDLNAPAHTLPECIIMVAIDGAPPPPRPPSIRIRIAMRGGETHQFEITEGMLRLLLALREEGLAGLDLRKAWLGDAVPVDRVMSVQVFGQGADGRSIDTSV